MNETTESSCCRTEGVNAERNSLKETRRTMIIKCTKYRDCGAEQALPVNVSWNSSAATGYTGEGQKSFTD